MNANITKTNTKTTTTDTTQNTYLIPMATGFIDAYHNHYDYYACIYTSTPKEAYDIAYGKYNDGYFINPYYNNYESFPFMLNLPNPVFPTSEKDGILKQYENKIFQYVDANTKVQCFTQKETIPNNSEENDTMKELYDYMYWGDYDQKIQSLADMAIHENWEYPDKGANYILKNYMKHTFWKLQSEDKVFTTGNYVLFNTGLYTPLYDPIYVYGEKNKTQNEKNYSEWIFRNYMTEYDLGEIGIYELPQRADYFSNPSQLIFDPTLKINVQYDHILRDARNIDRIQNIESKNIQSLLIGEIDKVKKRVAANYQLAIPQYFQNKIQLLLPLCLEDGTTPDIALVVTKSKNGKYYQGHTCITLDMAYNNARLIAKPENSWLTI